MRHATLHWSSYYPMHWVVAYGQPEAPVTGPAPSYFLVPGCSGGWTRAILIPGMPGSTRPVRPEECQQLILAMVGIPPVLGPRQ